MSWRAAALCWVAAAVFAGLYLSDLRRERGPRAVEALSAPQAAEGISVGTPTRVEIRRGDDRVVAWEKSGPEAWRVTAPPDRSVPSGLLNAFVEQLASLAHGEHIDGDAAEPAFGLGGSGLRVSVVDAEGRRTVFLVGDRTPTGTAAYAQVEGGKGVFLVGLSLLYYADLLFDAAR